MHDSYYRLEICYQRHCSLQVPSLDPLESKNLMRKRLLKPKELTVTFPLNFFFTVIRHRYLKNLKFKVTSKGTHHGENLIVKAHSKMNLGFTFPS